MTSPFRIKRYLRIGEHRVYLLTRISQRIVTNVEDYEHELPATRDRRSGPPGSGLVSERDRSGPSASRHQADMERGDGRGRRAHALTEPLQDRAGHRPLYRGADAGRHGRL